MPRFKSRPTCSSPALRRNRDLEHLALTRHVRINRRGGDADALARQRRSGGKQDVPPRHLDSCAARLIVLKLDDRQQLKLIPVNRYGYRLVAFVIPQQAGIAAATAYLSNGRYAITIPVNSPYGMTSFNSWVWHGPGGP